MAVEGWNLRIRWVENEKRTVLVHSHKCRNSRYDKWLEISKRLFMKLPFRLQFLLAPTITVIILFLLVAYTLVELSKIYDVNEGNKNWEVITDKMQITVASISRLATIARDIAGEKNIADDEQYFRYLEQTNIVYDNLFDPTLNALLPDTLIAKIKPLEAILHVPERADPQIIVASLNDLLPDLEYQYKLFVAQRRSVFIDSHRKIVSISIRMTIVLLATLTMCIALASIISVWGFRVTKNRLRQLAQISYSVCSDGNSIAINDNGEIDEIDELATCLSKMTQRVNGYTDIKHVLEGVENERRRIAMDVHDGVLSDLTAINRKLKAIVSADAADDKLESVREDVNDVIQHLRQTIDDLHPQVLETLGLEASVKSFLQRRSIVGEFPKFHFEFVNELENALSMQQKLALFRIVCEAINNSVNHSNGDQVEVSLRRVADQLVVSVEDNGKGISENEVNGGHGFANIKERAKIIFAKVSWRHSRFSSGTLFELNMPLLEK